MAPLAEIPISSSTCLGLDMVLTITSDPPFFSALAGKVKKAGGRVIVIVSRPSEERENTLQELGKYGLQYDDLVFLPPIEAAVQACPHRQELGHYGSYLWNKVHIADLSGVTHFVGAESLVRGLFARFLPNVVAHYPRDLYPREAFDPTADLVTTVSAQGVIATIECDLSTTPPTYRVQP
jgi:hypothetical protein